ncbi:phage tail-collar fiber domain-containing protein [Pseudomonas kilonensis]|uniref:phage tail-collar fiber domain-containing protein n=1 Tax=Pseudomonas kilonensis TaxID=132476 RepID=UPI00339A9E6D
MADYYTLLTEAGIAYETACKAAGTPIKLSQISVGDGGGAEYNPAATATALKREVWRGPLNALFQDENNPSWLLAEVTIPSDVGGWYVREAGIWTDTGILYAIVKYPESFKPVLATSGSGKEFYIRSIFETSNAELVTLLIDDTVVKATRAWVASYVADELAKLDRKQSARVATTANIVLSGAQAIDGVAVIAGNRVLVKSQTLAKDNGIYVAANGAWVRAKDADASVEVTSGLMVSVEEGATLANTIWQLITDGAIVLGTTGLTFQNVTQGFAPINSPAFLGGPTAPTAEQTVNNTQIATTAFAKTMLAAVGLGDVSPSATILDLDDATFPSGFYYTSATSTSNLPVQANGTVIHKIYGGGGLQILQAYANNNLLWRRRSLTQWEPWNSIAALNSPAFVGNPTAPTPPQFDNSLRLASTAFVKRMGVEWSNFNAVNVSTVLGSGTVGGIVSAASSTAVSLTMPPTGTVPHAGTILVLSAGSGVVTLLASGADILTNASGITTPIVLGQGDSALLSKVASEWRLVGGTAALKFSNAFAATFGNAANQVLPSGWIFKIGHGSTDVATGTVPVTFPVAFPTACMYVVAIYGGASSATNPSVCQSGIPTRTGFTGYITNVAGNNSAVTVGGYNWLAIGY